MISNEENAETTTVQDENTPIVLKAEERKLVEPLCWKKSYVLLPVALLDLLGTSLADIALIMTSAGSFQILQGT